MLRSVPPICETQVFPKALFRRLPRHCSMGHAARDRRSLASRRAHLVRAVRGRGRAKAVQPRVRGQRYKVFTNRGPLRIFFLLLSLVDQAFVLALLPKAGLQDCQSQADLVVVHLGRHCHHLGCLYRQYSLQVFPRLV